MIEDLAKNAKEFSKQLVNLAIIIDGDIETIIRASVLKLFINIVKRSPVDSGVYRASHMIMSGKMPGEKEGITEGSAKKQFQAMTSQERESMLGWRFDIENDEFIVIFNNVPYAERLEDGHSGQAPQGIYAVAMEEFNNVFREELKSHGY